jgi:hypothetical protein
MCEVLNLDLVPSLCPAQRALQARIEEVQAAPVCPTDKEDRVNGLHQEVAQVSELAAAINCLALEKGLPSVEQPVPAFGTSEREAFARLCPAYKALKESLKQAKQQEN